MTARRTDDIFTPGDMLPQPAEQAPRLPIAVRFALWVALYIALLVASGVAAVMLAGASA